MKVKVTNYLNLGYSNSIHVAYVCFKTYHFRLKGGLYLSVLETFPIDASEEGVFSDVPLSLSATAQTFGWVFSHQLLMATHTHKKNTVRLRIIIIIMIIKIYFNIVEH